MTQILQPGSVPAWSGDDPASEIDNVFSEQTWPALWPKLLPSYANEAARDAELAGLGTTDRAFAYIEDKNFLSRWNGTAWEATPKRRAVITVTGTTDANGFLTITHGQPFTPRAASVVNVNPASSFAVFWGSDTYGSATFRARFANANGGALASAAISGRAIVEE